MIAKITDNIRIVNENIAKICLQQNRNPQDITIVGVTKTKPAEVVEAAIQAGIKIIGENRVQEAAGKKQEVGSFAGWHLIGHLQTNKARKAIQTFDLIQSVDSLRLAEKLDLESRKLEKKTGILIQVNTSGETSKFGIEPEKTPELVEQISAKLGALRIMGLMTIGLFTDDPKKIRPCFVELRNLFEKIRELNFHNVQMRYLSMGMTGDYKIALEESSNMLRLGRVLFGERN